MYLLNTIYFVAIECPPLPLWDGYLLEDTAGDTYRQINSVANLTCPSPSVLTNGKATQQVTCLPSAQWYPPIQDCSGGTLIHL